MFRLFKYTTFGTVTAITGYSLHTNDYNINSVGIVRLTRAAKTVYDVGVTYKKNLYYRTWDKTSVEYEAQKKIAHEIAAKKLLELICINKGVFIKVGQHIGSLDYLLPPEYVNTMKVLHSNAPKNCVEDLYKVIKQDLKKNVRILLFSFAQNVHILIFIQFHSLKNYSKHLMQNRWVRLHWLRYTELH